MYLSMKASRWIFPLPTPPLTLQRRINLKDFPQRWAIPLPHPAPYWIPSRPVSLPSSSPESCPARGCQSPSTWSPLYRVPSPCKSTRLCLSTGHAWKTGMWCSGSSKVRQWRKITSFKYISLKNQFLRPDFKKLFTISSLHRLSRCRWETWLPGLCIFPLSAWSASIPARAAWCGLNSGSPGHSGGGAWKQGPAQLLVAMQTGKSK